MHFLLRRLLEVTDDFISITIFIIVFDTTISVIRTLGQSMSNARINTSKDREVNHLGPLKAERKQPLCFFFDFKKIKMAGPKKD